MSRDSRPLRADWPIVFRSGAGGASCASGTVCWRHGRRLGLQRGCTKHCLRGYRREMARAEGLRRVLCALETSLSPPTVLRTREAAHCGAPGRRRCGGGAAHGNHPELAPSVQAREQASKQPRRGRGKSLWAHGRSETQGRHAGRARSRGSAQHAPVRPPARLSRSLRSGATCPERTLGPVATGPRPRVPIAGQGGCRPCRCRGCARVARGIADLPDGAAATRRQRRKRPIAGPRYRAWPPRFQTVCLRLPSPM